MKTAFWIFVAVFDLTGLGLILVAMLHDVVCGCCK